MGMGVHKHLEIWSKWHYLAFVSFVINSNPSGVACATAVNKSYNAETIPRNPLTH